MTDLFQVVKAWQLLLLRSPEISPSAFDALLASTGFQPVHIDETRESVEAAKRAWWISQVALEFHWLSEGSSSVAEFDALLASSGLRPEDFGETEASVADVRLHAQPNTIDVLAELRLAELADGLPRWYRW